MAIKSQNELTQAVEAKKPRLGRPPGGGKYATYDKRGDPIREDVAPRGLKGPVVNLTGRTKSPRRNTDITLAPDIIASLRRAQDHMGAYANAIISAALKATYAAVVTNPATLNPQLPPCHACGRPHVYHRPFGTKKRRRFSVSLSDADIAALTHIADNYYNGTFSRALEAAIIYHFPAWLLPEGAKESI